MSTETDPRPAAAEHAETLPPRDGQSEVTEATPVRSRSVAALTRAKFAKNRLALVGLTLLAILYLGAAFAEFVAPYTLKEFFPGKEDHPPTPLHFVDREGRFHLRPFVYEYSRQLDRSTFHVSWKPDYEKRYPLYFFRRIGSPYKPLGVLPVTSRLRLFGVQDGQIFLFGTDKWGRDTFSRVFYGSRISLTIGFVGVCVSLFLGILMGGVSGYFGGTADFAIQRLIEVLMSVPSLPLWVLLSASLPKHWNSIQVYFGLVVILSLLSWPSAARVVRGMVLSLRSRDSVAAARNLGAGPGRIIARHIVPAMTSYLLVSVTLSVPGMIIGETSLSFLGLGIRPPMTSWGTLLQEAQKVQNVVNNPWYLIPALFVIAAVLSFNFVGDGLRDAADPFSRSR